MLHKTATTTATTTDRGEFSALAATWSLDRQNEQIRRGAFAETILKWQASGRQVPVHRNHQGEAANVIGGIDPASMAETVDGLYVEGRLDLKDSEVAREAWRSMKADRVALSFGFMTVDSVKRADGVRELLAVDLFEVSIVPSPANPDTRLLSLKGANDFTLGEPDRLPSHEEIGAKVKQLLDEAPRPIRVERFEC